MNKILLRVRLDRETERQCSNCTRTTKCTGKNSIRAINMLVNPRRSSVLGLHITLKYLSLLEGKCNSYAPKGKDKK